MTTRREFIKKSSLLSGAAVIPNILPDVIQKALAINPNSGSTFYDAEHIVFLMQENRSFDHMFGTLRGVRGFNDPHPHILPNKDRVWLQRDEKGNAYMPFHIDLNKTKITWQGGLAHSWPDQIGAFNHGRYDKWIPQKSTMCLGYYKREDLPFYYELADAFTICDHYFCSSQTGTTPNRLFFWTGNIRPNPLDKSRRAVVNNSQAESHTNTYIDWTTFPELLEKHGVDWRVYQNELWTARLKGETDDWCGNYGDNALEYVKRHRVKLSAYFRKNGDASAKPPLTADEVLEKYNQLSETEKNLIDKAFTTNIENKDYLELAPHTFKNENGEVETLNIPKEDIFYQFRKDVNEGNLPTVSWLVAPQRFSDHTSSPLYGTWYVSEALNILVQNPEVWKKTIFIVNYDENDGYFDHIPPFVVPKPNEPKSGKVSQGINTHSDFDEKDSSAIGLGFRVPMIVCSPWSRGGVVNSQVFDHTSTLMFLENYLKKTKGIDIHTEQISSWRRAICGDMTSIFQPYLADKVDSPQALKRDTVINHIQSVKSNPRQLKPHALSQENIERINRYYPFDKNAPSLMARQEKGVKRANALPYYFSVDAKIDKKQLKIMFKTEKSSVGVPFKVVALNKYQLEKGRVWNFAVKSNDSLDEIWNIEDFEDGVYDLAVYGPNGFYRRFKGRGNEPLVDVVCECAKPIDVKDELGKIEIILNNKSKVSLKLFVKDEFYGLINEVIELRPKAKKTIKLTLNKSQNWYQLTVKILDNKYFDYCYAGHFEDGKLSFTDLFMGNH